MGLWWQRASSDDVLQRLESVVERLEAATTDLRTKVDEIHEKKDGQLGEGDPRHE